MHLCGDTSKVFELTGWKPEIDINEGLRLTIDWIKSNLDLLNQKFIPYNKYESSNFSRR